MDFRQELKLVLQQFPHLIGIVFADPDGESIVFEAPAIDEFNLLLAGAKMPILLNTGEAGTDQEQVQLIDLEFESHFILATRLDQGYSITAIGSNSKHKPKLKLCLKGMAKKFNEEIV